MVYIFNRQTKLALDYHNDCTTPRQEAAAAIEAVAVARLELRGKRRDRGDF